MIETALVFAFGALAAGLIALLLVPAFTRRAARLARRDLEARLPRTLDEIAAMRDGVRADYAARCARVEAALSQARQSLSDERLVLADMQVQLTALKTERRGYEGSLEDAERRVSDAFAELRTREEALARALAEKRELDREVKRLAERLADAEARAGEAERLAGEMRMTLVAAEASALALADNAAGRGLSPLHGATAATPVIPVAAAVVSPVTVAAVADPSALEGADAPPAGELPAPVPERRGLPPEVAATLAERLRAMRRADATADARPVRERPEEGPATPMPVAATFEIRMPDAGDEAPPEETPAPRGAPTLRDERLPKVHRRFPRPGEKTFEPVLPSANAADAPAPVPVVEPRIGDADAGPGSDAAPVTATAFTPRPIPVVIRTDRATRRPLPFLSAEAADPDVPEAAGPGAGGKVGELLAEMVGPVGLPAQDAAEPAAVKPTPLPDAAAPDAGASTATDEAIARKAGADASGDPDPVETAGPEPVATAEPAPVAASPGPVQDPGTAGPEPFTGLPTPSAAMVAEADLAPEERNRRVEDLAARLRSLRTRNAAARRTLPPRSEPAMDEAEAAPAEAKSS